MQILNVIMMTYLYGDTIFIFSRKCAIPMQEGFHNESYTGLTDLQKHSQGQRDCNLNYSS